MKILAIDPGPTESAYMVWDGRMVAGLQRSNDDIVQLIRQGSFADCRLMAIEMIACYGMPVGKETFETCVWIGRFIQANRNLEIHEMMSERLVYRREVKIHLCGSMKAKDGNIRASIIDRFGGKQAAIGNKKNQGPLYGVSGHLWSALAVALLVEDGILGQDENKGLRKVQGETPAISVLSTGDHER